MAGYRGGQVKTNIDGLDKAITVLLQDYTDEVSERIIQAASDVADEAVEKLKSTSPKEERRGYYAKGWTKQRVLFKRARAVRFSVHNKSYYNLTHLLEYGHVTRNGGRTSAQSHIKPVEEWAKEEMVRRAEEAVKGEY